MQIINNNAIYKNNEFKPLADKFKKYWKKNINSKLGKKFFYIVNNHREEIEKFRLELGLSKEYFKKEKQVLDWINKEVKKITNPTKGIKQIDRIIPYENCGLALKREPEKSVSVYIKEKKTDRTTFNFLFEKKVKKFAAKIGLDNSWYLQFQRYLLFGETKMYSLTDCGIKIVKKLSSYPDSLPFEGKVILELSPNIRLKDIEFIWEKQVKPLLETLPGFIKIFPNKKVKKI